MKTNKLLLVISEFIIFLAMVCGLLWVIISFILYLVKDTPFHWWSVYTTTISVVTFFILMIVLAVRSNKVDAIFESGKTLTK
jgi:uncharacterized membrane protein